jgi:hypothetical protein
MKRAASKFAPVDKARTGAYIRTHGMTRRRVIIQFIIQ